MKRSLRKLALTTALACGAPAAIGQTAAPPATPPPLEHRIGKSITVRELNRAAEKCTITRAWKMADGNNAMEAVSAETGEKLTIVEKVGAKTPAEMFRVYRWAKAGLAPSGCPLPPDQMLAKNDPPKPVAPKPISPPKPVDPPKAINPPKVVNPPKPVEPKEIQPVVSLPKEIKGPAEPSKPVAVKPPSEVKPEPKKDEPAKPASKLPPPEVVGGTITLYDKDEKPFDCEITQLFTPTGGGKGMVVKVKATGEVWTIIERPNAHGEGVVLDVIRQELPGTAKNEPEVKPVVLPEPPARPAPPAPPTPKTGTGEMLVFTDSKGKQMTCEVIQYFRTKEGYPAVYARIVDTGEMVTIFETPQSGTIDKVWTVKPDKAPAYVTKPGHKPGQAVVKNDPPKPVKPPVKPPVDPPKPVKPPVKPPKDPKWRETWGPTPPKNPKPVEPPVVVKENEKPVKIDVTDPKKPVEIAKNDPPKPIEPPKRPVETPKPVDPPKKLVEPPKPVDLPKKPVEPPKPVGPPKKPVEPPKPVDPPKKPVEPPKPIDPPKKPVEPPKPVDPPKKPVEPPKPIDPPKVMEQPTEKPPLGTERPVPIPGVPLHSTGPRPNLPPPQPNIRPFNTQEAPEYDPREPDRAIPAVAKQSPNPYDYPPRVGPAMAGPVSPTQWSRGPVIPASHTQAMAGMDRNTEAEALRNTVFLMTVLQSSGDSEQREWAAKRLRVIDPDANPYAVDSLVTAAKSDPAPMVRAAAVESLAYMGASGSTVQAVVENAMQDRDPRVRDQAVTAGEMMKGSKVVPADYRK